ncbi:MAG: transcriptional regulator, family [Firmicutes bacterium]|nr:transcriptional regulator, family [Bacillota bacterium]
MATFQIRFNILFEEKNLSQEEFGKLFNASKSQIFNWRTGRGEPDIEMLKNIARTCNVSVEWLTGNSDFRKPINTIAAHRTDDPSSELPEDARKSLEDFKRFLYEKHGLKY